MPLPMCMYECLDNFNHIFIIALKDKLETQIIVKNTDQHKFICMFNKACE